MTESASQVTIATSSGAVWLALIVHFGAGLVALTSGFVAISAAKGGRLHRRAGTFFVISMVALGVFAAGIATYERKVTGDCFMWDPSPALAESHATSGACVSDCSLHPGRSSSDR